MMEVNKLFFILTATFATALNSSASANVDLSKYLQNGELEFIPATTQINGRDIEKTLPVGSPEFEVELPNPKKEIVVNAADFGLSESVENAATIINKALAHCKKIGASKLSINKGTYKCFDAVSINLDSFQDFTIDFNGSTLIYYSKSKKKAAEVIAGWNTKANRSNPNIKISDCLRVKVCNVNFDWDWENDPLGSFAKVEAINSTADKPYVDLKFWQYETYPRYNKPTSVISVASFTDDLSAFHHKRSGLFFPAPQPIHLAEGYNTAETEWVSPNTMRLFTPYGNALALGGVYRVMHYYVGKNGIDMVANKHLTLENINIYSCRGHAMHVDEGQQYWQCINLRVAPPEGDARRATSCSGDHNHIANSCGFLKLENCFFSMGQDDGANIHDRSFFMKKSGERVLESANKRGLSYFDPQVGDEIILKQDDYSDANYKGKIIKIDGEKVEFDKPLPEQKGEGFVCFNAKYGTKNIIIRNCKYIRHGCRGLLLPAKNVTVENCVFEREQMGAIKLESGYTKSLWCEGYGVDNIVVRNCTFKKCNLRGLKSQGFMRDIMLASYIKTDPSDIQAADPLIKNVLFENNKFFDTRGLTAVISSSENVTFRNNTISNEFDYGENTWYRGDFYVQYSNNVDISNNTFVRSEKSPNCGVITKKSTVKNLTISNNKIVDKF